MKVLSLALLPIFLSSLALAASTQDDNGFVLVNGEITVTENFYKIPNVPEDSDWMVVANGGLNDRPATTLVCAPTPKRKLNLRQRKPAFTEAQIRHIFETAFIARALSSERNLPPLVKHALTPLPPTLTIEDITPPEPVGNDNSGILCKIDPEKIAQDTFEQIIGLAAPLVFSILTGLYY